jgi:hypothetical protein
VSIVWRAASAGFPDVRVGAAVLGAGVDIVGVTVVDTGVGHLIGVRQMNQPRTGFNEVFRRVSVPASGCPPCGIRAGF